MSHITILSRLCSIIKLTSRNQRHTRTRTEHRSSPAWLSKHSFLLVSFAFHQAPQRAVARFRTLSANKISESKRVYCSLAKLTVLVALIHSVSLHHTSPDHTLPSPLHTRSTSVLLHPLSMF